MREIMQSSPFRVFFGTSLVILILSLFTACNTEPSCSSQSLSIALGEEPISLDPRSCQLVRDIMLVQHLFEGLTRLDHVGVAQPALAKTIEVSPDGRTYTFTLRDSFWSNGSRLKSSDFLYAWNQLRQSPCPLKEATFATPEENKVIIQLKKPQPYLLQWLALPSNFPICQEVDQKDKQSLSAPGKNFISNGPFTMKSWKSHTELVLEKNPLYWDQEHVYLKEIILPIISDPATEFYLFEKGDLDWFGQPLSNPILKEIIQKLREEGKLSSYPVSGTCFLRCNTEKTPFDNALLRRAFAQVIPRKKIITHILQGNQLAATKLVPSQEARGYFSENDSMAKMLFQQYLTESGKKFPTIVFSYSAGDRNSKMAQFLKEVWEKNFGITVILDASEKKYFREKVSSGNYEMAIGDWIADFNDPSAFLDLFKEDDKFNQTHWHNSTYTELVNRAEEENDEDLRLEDYQKAEAILMDAMPIIPLYHYCFDFVKKEVRDYTLSPLGMVDFKSAKK